MNQFLQAYIRNSKWWNQLHHNFNKLNWFINLNKFQYPKQKQIIKICNLYIRYFNWLERVSWYTAVLVKEFYFILFEHLNTSTSFYLSYRMYRVYIILIVFRNYPVMRKFLFVPVGYTRHNQNFLQNSLQ